MVVVVVVVVVVIVAAAAAGAAAAAAVVVVVVVFHLRCTSWVIMDPAYNLKNCLRYHLAISHNYSSRFFIACAHKQTAFNSFHSS